MNVYLYSPRIYENVRPSEDNFLVEAGYEKGNLDEKLINTLGLLDKKDSLRVFLSPELLDKIEEVRNWVEDIIQIWAVEHNAKIRIQEDINPEIFLRISLKK